MQTKYTHGLLCCVVLLQFAPVNFTHNSRSDFIDTENVYDFPCARVKQP